MRSIRWKKTRIRFLKEALQLTFTTQKGQDSAGMEDKVRSGIDYIYKAVKTGGCDLHLHTRFSDGADTVPALVQNVMAGRLKCFAVTDHDSIDAIPEVISLLGMLRSLGFVCPEFIPGIEISVDFEKEIHVLGYFPFGGYERMGDFIKIQRKSRLQRNIEMCGCLSAMGMPVTVEELNAEGDNAVGRLHAAKILVRKGYVGSVSEAFDNIFGYGMPCYIKRDKPGIQEAVSSIRDAGGVAVLAHPYLYKWTGGSGVVSPLLMKSLQVLKDNGLSGVEAFHGESTRDQKEETFAAAVTLGLIPTAGSDYHGINKPGLSMYTEKNSFLAGETKVEAAAVIESDNRILVVSETGDDFVQICRLPGLPVPPGVEIADSLERFAASRICSGLKPAGYYTTAFSSNDNGRNILVAYRFNLEGPAAMAEIGLMTPPDGNLHFATFQELALSRMPAEHAAVITMLREISLFDQ
ncbi:MAG: PHP domain-containing protein [Saccharofermentanales bacterium]